MGLKKIVLAKERESKKKKNLFCCKRNGGRTQAEMRRTLYVGGLAESIKEEELAYEFQRYGRLVRCDIPNRARGFAFVEFENERFVFFLLFFFLLFFFLLFFLFIFWG